MANIKSAKKMSISKQKKAERNKSIKSAVKTLSESRSMLSKQKIKRQHLQHY